MVNKRVRNTVLGCNLKNDRMISVLFPRHTIQYHSNPSLCLNQWCWRSGSWTVVGRNTNLLELTPKKMSNILARIKEARQYWLLLLSASYSYPKDSSIIFYKIKMKKSDTFPKWEVKILVWQFLDWGSWE